MGFRRVGEDANRFRFSVGEGGPSEVVDLLCVPDMRHGTMGAGAVHHVAFRTPDDEQQKAWQIELARRGLNVSPVMDRKYFHSIYYREPGGVLFEIATDAPGFAVDEDAEHLGENLMLPAQYEQYRQELYKLLPTVKLPGGAQVGAAR
jgi:glyoxalase family protein